MFEKHPNLSDDINNNIQKSEIDGGAWLDKLPIGKGLKIQTKNTLYILRKNSEKDFTLQGSPKYCPEPTKAMPHGSTWGGSMLRIAFIGRGMHMEVWLEGIGTIKTSTIQEVTEID